MIWQTFSGTMAFTALIHTRASALPMVSMALAALRTMRRMASISIRALEMTSMFLPRWAIGLPNASRWSPRRHISSMARSAAPMDRMQWWMRPGPRRSWEISNPLPSPSSMFDAGTRASLKVMCMWPCGASSSPKTCIGWSTVTPGVSMGTRICDWRRCGGPSGLVCSIVIITLQRGSPAPEM